MNRKSALDNNFVHYILLALVVCGAVLSLVMIKKYTGFAGTQISSEAGTITAILIEDRSATPYWGGLFGLVFSQSDFNDTQTATIAVGEITSFTAVFSCVDPNKAENEMYASLNTSINFSNLRAGTTNMVDIDYLNLSNSTKERANTSFIENISILVGTTNISGIPAVYTYVSDAPDSNKKFYTGILNDSGRLVFVTKIFATSQKGFKGTNIDYQILLPARNSSAAWYFFADPNDECPAGFGSGQVGDSIINGYIFEVNSTTPIPNVTVSAGGNSSLTNSNGFFNFTAFGGVSYELVAIKSGYVTNITTINTTIGATTRQNMTMSRFYGFVGENSTLSGYVKDNSSGAIISNATISIAGLTALSNATGNYSLVIVGGTHVIAAVKNGYQNFVGNFSINGGANISFIINMSAAVSAGESQNGTVVNNGTVQGFVTDNSTSAVLAGVTVTVAGESNITNSAGFYNITALQGTTNLVAVKSGYSSYAHEVNISANNITKYNFSMSPVTVSAGAGNGSVSALVRTSSGTALSGVSVSVAGKSNSTNSSGGALLTGIPEGIHNLVATKSGYANNFTVINISTNELSLVNITMKTTAESGLGAGSGAGKGSGSGAGKGAGQGAGRGAGTGIASQSQKTIEVKDYDISVKRILKKLRLGNFEGSPLSITNYKTESIDIKFSVVGDVKKLARLDKERLIIEGGSTGDVLLTLLGNAEPGVYEGYLAISGDINEQIPIYVLVLEKERLSVESLIVKITPVNKIAAAGDEFKYTVDLQNLLSDEKYKVSLSYSIDGINNNRSVFLEKEDIVIHTSFSLLKSLKIPNDFEVGDYALKVKADFLDLSAEHSAIFTVAEPIYKYAVLGVVPLWILMLLVTTLSAGTFSVAVYKKRAREKERYKIELDYSQLFKAGPRSAFAGNIAETSNRAYFDLDLFQVHTLIAGSSGSGKSIVAQDLVEEALLKGVATIVFDPTAQWTGFLRKCDDKRLLNAYGSFGMKKASARAFNGNVHQVENAREMVEFHKFMKPGEINIFVTNKLDTKDIELFVSNTIRQVFHANLPESRELKYLMVYDGIHSLLPKFGGSGQVFVQIERATREFRKWGIGLILISQVLSDFPPEVLANINTEIQLRTRDEGDLNRTKEKYGDKILQSVVKAAVGTGVVQNSAYNKGKPYFVSFRPPLHGTQRISDEQLENYNKYNAIIDDMDYQLEQLEKEGIDIFDLKLELKLAQDKVKSGGFNMVNIYLDGLKPRIDSQWAKIGKKPKKREIQYISESELGDELEKAKQDRKKYNDGERAAENKKARSEAGADESKKLTEAKANENPDMLAGMLKKIDSLSQQIKEFAEKNEKQKAIDAYSEVQSIYKGAPKDLKAKLLPNCVEMQKLLAGREENKS